MIDDLEKIAKSIRYYILTSTTEAGSGHPTSSLSATDLMVSLMFGGHFRFQVERPEYENNDRLIFSKGHAAPLLYALWVAARALKPNELTHLRKFGSYLEGHPTMAFPYTEAATGSLGQGLSVGVGMALTAKYLTNYSYRTFVLMGDSEMSEGSVWEAIQLAAKYKLDNLIAICDINRLGQRGETMYGHNISAYEERVRAFGWETITVDGHSFADIERAWGNAFTIRERPVMILAKTIKGKGVSWLENKDGWHGKALKPEELERALNELGEVDADIKCRLSSPEKVKSEKPVGVTSHQTSYESDMQVSTREAYGKGLLSLFDRHRNLVVLDAETSNSTYAVAFGEVFPERFFEMYIAEQNMVGTALGLARRGQLPFVSTFSAFFTRAFDQIRMNAYSKGNITYVGSHAGVAIGEDGSSQMGLEDIALFRSIEGSAVLYPADGNATIALMSIAAEYEGTTYIRTTRQATPILYRPSEQFVIGGSKVLKKSKRDQATIVAAGITLHEALTAWSQLETEGIYVRVIDLYSIKPIDARTLLTAAHETNLVITVEDHHIDGGLGEAVDRVLTGIHVTVVNLAVTKPPMSGNAKELLAYEEIDATSIMKQIKKLIKK